MAKRHLKRIITRRKAKWAGLVLCLLLATLFIASRWTGLGVKTISKQGVLWDVSVERGRLALYERVSTHVVLPKRQSSFRVWFNVPPMMYLWVDVSQRIMISGDRVRRARVPLWMPLLLVAAPTAWLFRVDRHLQRWQCQECGYDLRGLEAGNQDKICPECGSARREA